MPILLAIAGQKVCCFRRHGGFFGRQVIQPEQGHQAVNRGFIVPGQSQPPAVPGQQISLIREFCQQTSPGPQCGVRIASFSRSFCCQQTLAAGLVPSLVGFSAQPLIVVTIAVDSRQQEPHLGNVGSHLLP